MSGIFKHTYIWLFVLIIVGTFLHFYNLDWGAPYYFHPDERNVASSVSQLSFPTQMNPHFFAYGTLPIYVIYFSGVVVNAISHCWTILPQCMPTDLSILSVFQTPDWLTIASVKFEQAIIISRFYSAFLATVIILVVYKLANDIHSTHAGLLAALLTTTSVGVIQFAHFGTFEIWLTFFGSVLALACIKLIQTKKSLYFFAATIVVGILIAVKISSIVLLPLPLLAFFISYHKQPLLHHKKQFGMNLVRTIFIMIPFLFFAALVYFLTNPYVYWEYSAFRGSMNYESGVALGTIPVFYTHEFLQAQPVLFHFLHVYPFLINPLLTFLFIPAIFYYTYITFKKKNASHFILYVLFLILFLSQAFFFVKWVRYMVPTIPFIHIIIAIAIIDLLPKIKPYGIRYTLYAFLILTCALFAFSYFKTVLASPDSRISARDWLKHNFKPTTESMSEIYDMGIVPFNELPMHITLCDIYTIEWNIPLCNGKTLSAELAESRYIISPSQRIIKTRITMPKRYPEGNKYYQSLFSGKLGYTKIYETPCDIWCNILYLGNPTFSFEQTANVFDRPVVMIFEKK